MNVLAEHIAPVEKALGRSGGPLSTAGGRRKKDSKQVQEKGQTNRRAYATEN